MRCLGFGSSAAVSRRATANLARSGGEVVGRVIGSGLTPLPSDLQVCRAAMERDDVEVVGASCRQGAG